MHVHILGAYVHICARYEVSVIKPVARRTVHRWYQWQCQIHHMKDNSWLHRLICYQQMRQQSIFWCIYLMGHFVSAPVLCLHFFESFGGTGGCNSLKSRIPTFPDWQISLTFPVFLPFFQYLFLCFNFSKYGLHLLLGHCITNRVT